MADIFSPMEYFARRANRIILQGRGGLVISEMKSLVSTTLEKKIRRESYEKTKPKFYSKQKAYYTLSAGGVPEYGSLPKLGVCAN